MSTPIRDRTRTSPYRDDLCRTATFHLTRDGAAPTNGDGLSISGYGAVFNSVTKIDSWEGEFDEVIAPGAFKKSLRENTPKMQFDHGKHPLLGSLPLGVWTTAEEDSRGLHLVGRLTDNWLIQPFRDSIRDGGIDGMSFRFTVVDDKWTDKDGKNINDSELSDLLWYGAGERGPILRTLRELKVSEAGPVMWPAYQDTEVDVRSRPVVTIDLAQINTPQARRDLARAVVIADAAAARTPQTPDAPSGDPSEPRSTTVSADEHPAGPQVTDTGAGEHSSSAEERRARMHAGLATVRAAMSKIKT